MSADILKSQTPEAIGTIPLKLRRSISLACAALLIGAAAGADASTPRASSGLQPAGTPSQCPQLQLQYDGWTRIAPSPAFTTPLVDYAVQADKPLNLLQTDGRIVTRSTDGGCSSSVVYTSPELPLGVTANLGDLGVTGISEIRSLEMASNGGTLAMALMELGLDSNGTVPHQTVVASSPDGAKWTTGQAGAPLLGAPLQLAIANQTTAYVLTQTTLGNMVWSTTNAGTLWLPKGTGLDITHVTVDPNHPMHLYGWNDKGLYDSGDGGLSFNPVLEVTGAINDVRAYQVAETTLFEVALKGGGLQLGIYNAQPGAVVSWRKLASLPISEMDRSPGNGLGSLLAYVLNDFVSNGDLYLGQRAVDGSIAAKKRTPAGAGKVRRPQTSEGGWLMARDNAAIWRSHVELKPDGHGSFEADISRPAVRAVIQDVDLGDAELKDGLPAHLQPLRQVVKALPGHTAKANLKLDLPAVPTPLDVMFLIDTTSSMGPTIDGLKAGIGQIIDDFVSSGIDVHFGLADFQDYPVAPWGCGGRDAVIQSNCSNADIPDHPYVRRLPISKPGPALAAALKALKPSNGGDGPEATLAGIYQAATGVGQSRGGLQANRYFIEPHQGAEFRPGAVKVIIVATDVRFHVPRALSDGGPCPPSVLQTSSQSCNDEVGYPGPSFATTVAALNTRNIRVMGLDVSGSGNEGKALADERRIALETSTFAPADGVDCDGDGHLDIAAGKPLACPIEVSGGDYAPLQLAPAVVALLKSLRDRQDLTFQLIPEGEKKPVAVLSPSFVPQIDVKSNNVVGVSAALKCPSGADSSHPMRVIASIRGEVVANSHILLDCIGPKKPARTIVIPPLLPPIAPAAQPAPPPPANPQANPNPQINPQLGAASQQEEEAELATVNETGVTETEDSPEGTTSLAMSSYRAREDESTSSAWAFELAVLGLLSAGAAAMAIRSRRRLYFASSEVRDSRTTVTRI